MFVVIAVVDKFVHVSVYFWEMLYFWGKEKALNTSEDWLWRWNYTMSGSQRWLSFPDKENQVICSPINYFMEEKAHEKHHEREYWQFFKLINAQTDP